MADTHLSLTELERWRDHGDGDRERIVSHLARCAECRHAAAELERMRPAEELASPFDPKDFVAEGYRAGSQVRRHSMLRPAYLAAAAAVLLAVMFVPSWLRDRTDSTFRGDGTAVTLISPLDSAVPASQLAFEWSAVPNVDRLRLRVVLIDDPAQPLIDRAVSGTRYEPTAEERARLRAGGELHWFIEYREAGTATGVSPAGRFRVR